MKGLHIHRPLLRVETMYRCIRRALHFATAQAIVLATHVGMAEAQYGVAISGAGPVNRSMGGASTAAPLDASGTLYWNPAAITGLSGSQLDVGLEALYPTSYLSSSLLMNSLGQSLPQIDLAGSDRSDSGVFLLPTVGLVYQSCDSPVAFGLGLFSAGGFAVNYPGSLLANPILSPPPPNGFGLGPISAELQVFQVVPTVACRLTDNLSVGIGPTLSLARLIADPAFLASPDDANLDTFPTYPAATHGRIRAGGGVQAGLFYTTGAAWHFGASVKSPQWFETFRYNSTNEIGRPRDVAFRFDYPLMASVGVSYTGCPRWIFATDFRYIDYENTKGFDTTGFDATGRVTGLGWDSVFAVAMGAQYALTQCTAVRHGLQLQLQPHR